MTYSCTDMADDLLNALNVTIPDEADDNPSMQADIAMAEIERLQAGQRGLLLDNEETAIILAGLRTLQRVGVDRAEMDIATDGGEFDVMSDDEIDLLCERINCDEPLAPVAYPIGALAVHWSGAAEKHRDAMRAAGTTTDDSPDERKARAADAVAVALAAYAQLLDVPPPASLTDWHAIAGKLVGALNGTVEQINQMHGMFGDADGAIQQALDDAEEAMTVYSAPPAAPSSSRPVVVVLEGGLCQTVVSDDPALIGKPYTVLDYDTEGADEVSRVLQNNGKYLDAVIGGGTIEEASICIEDAAPAAV
jgi:rhodanese-related sulfurtransferase